jgi:galactokinase/mevalonate kinase-like predicted kinase
MSLGASGGKMCGAGQGGYGIIICEPSASFNEMACNDPNFAFNPRLNEAGVQWHN